MSLFAHEIRHWTKRNETQSDAERNWLLKVECEFIQQDRHVLSDRAYQMAQVATGLTGWTCTMRWGVMTFTVESIRLVRMISLSHTLLIVVFAFLSLYLQPNNTAHYSHPKIKCNKNAPSCTPSSSSCFPFHCCEFTEIWGRRERKKESLARNVFLFPLCSSTFSARKLIIILCVALWLAKGVLFVYL